MSHGLPEWTICGRLGDEEKLHNCVDMVDSIDCMKKKIELPKTHSQEGFHMVCEREAGWHPYYWPVLRIQAHPSDFDVSKD